ncbi:RNA polymerase recycling motor ATPase HelR [Glycomyces terrestris]|uniref:RNA polymerase recycling motor ATPase HelR n=1 Tax=Glycomyces terrestris TaxID=2493553 RepID=UPI0018D50ACF|nr:RNA polymerase recycling motor ATPase HelR [Glycomyces terrestris]
MSAPRASAFDLPERLSAKADPALIAADERHFADIAATLERSVADLSAQLAALRRAPGGTGRFEGQDAADRDRDIHRLTGRIATLRRYGLDLCLGKAVGRDGTTVYIGRIGLTDGAGRRLLVDWRSPAAEPFFGATHGEPMGLESRRRYRWTGGRITDYWDEVFDADGFAGHAAALDDQSAFIASLGTERSERMRDVLGTIQADQDAVIRAPASGALVVDGGPGTGKTVVALHRAAYLLYSDPRLGHHRGDILVVGPSEPYLAYVSDVLPSLGEEGVQTCTLRDLVPGGADLPAEADPEVARLKASAELVRAVEAAARRYELPPQRGMRLDTPWGEAYLSAADWADAFGAAGPAVAHNEARDLVWRELVAIVLAKLPEDAAEEPLRRDLARDREFRTAFDKAWPLIEPADLVAAFWASPEFLAWCAPHLGNAEVARLQRPDPFAWTASDLPLLDAARRRLGDAEASRRARRREAEIAAEREVIDKVVEDILEAGDGNVEEMVILHGADLQDALVHYEDLEEADPDPLAGPFAHIVVDEAQELTDAEWQMLLQRCPSRSFTIVGDRAQARRGFTESWTERLERVGMGRVDIRSLTINYRTPEEVMAEAERVVRAALPDANVPTSVRRGGVPVGRGSRADLEGLLEDWLASHPEGTACVIGDPGFAARPRVRSLTPELSKGLEFDLVVLVDPEDFGDGIEGAVDRYVAMTRATQRLVVLTS